MTDAILAAKPDALYIGITTDRFWSMTYEEILDELEAYNRRREADVKDQMWIQAQMDYTLAKLINLAVWDPKNIPDTVQKAYPGIFPKEDPKLTWQESKEQFKAYAEAHNRQKGGGMQ